MRHTDHEDKVLAAMRAGITTVMLPKRNQKDLQDVPQEAREWPLRVRAAAAARGRMLSPPRWPLAGWAIRR